MKKSFIKVKTVKAPSKVHAFSQWLNDCLLYPFIHYVGVCVCVCVCRFSVGRLGGGVVWGSYRLLGDHVTIYYVSFFLQPCHVYGICHSADWPVLKSIIRRIVLHILQG